MRNYCTHMQCLHLLPIERSFEGLFEAIYRSRYHGTIGITQISSCLGVIGIDSTYDSDEVFSSYILIQIDCEMFPSG